MEITPKKKEAKRNLCVCAIPRLAEFAADNWKSVSEGPRAAGSQGISMALGILGDGSGPFLENRRDFNSRA